MGPDHPRHGSLLVGRDRELATLRERLMLTLDGRGGLVLVSGEAGVGKTALAEALCAEAAAHGALVLVGRCYDLAETPPYGPWIEAFAHLPRSADLPPIPNVLDTTARSPEQFFAVVRDFFAATTASGSDGPQPLVVLLDDLHWADSISLDLLRFLARSLSSLPVLVVATYRSDDLTRAQPLYRLLPLLARESHATRLELGPLSRAALADLVGQRYHLTTFDAAQLVAYLWLRTDGNALFATELLRTLEERDMLSPDGALLEDVETVGVPTLLRQVVEGRVARLGAEAEQLLGIAAVIGQEVPLALWAAIAEVDAAAVERVAERALGARLLREVGGDRLAFAHALIREALYESIPGIRRRPLHRRIGEALALTETPPPDMVAYHFRQADDPRMAQWLVRAGWQAYRSLAYHMARVRFVEALPHVEGAQRVRVLLALAFLSRYRDRGVDYATEALEAARASGDPALIGMALFHVGANLGYKNRVEAGLAAMTEADAILDHLPDDAFASLTCVPGLLLSREERRSHRAWLLSYSGRWRETIALLDGTPEALAERVADLDAHGRTALWFLSALLGRPESMRRAIEAMIATSEERGEDLAVLATRISEGYSFMLTFFADDPQERARYEKAVARATKRVEETLGAVPPLLNRCPLLVVAGRWDEAVALWEQRHKALTNSGDTVMNLPYIAMMLMARGDAAAAWALMHEGLPAGRETAPGTTHFNATVRLMPLAVRLSLLGGDHEQARQWLAAQDRHFAWFGPEVCWGRSDAHRAWAEYCRAVGEPEQAMEHVQQALAIASAPRQPLDLLASHRAMGILLTDARRYTEAAYHLEQALALADACGAPFHQAMTALAMGELYIATGKPEDARRYLGSARTNCQRLGARFTLARVTALTRRIAATAFPASDYPAGLTAREAEVLGLVAQGWTGRQVAEYLSLSPRTVNQHLRSIYNKLGVSTRAAATRFAVAHGMV